MKIFYIANARIPTEKANGIAILKACESLARAGASVRLILPRRRASSAEVFDRYGIQKNFDIVRLPTLDLYGYVPNLLAFYLQTATFYSAAKLWLLFRSRASIIYTRDVWPLFFAWLGYRVVYECHHLSGYRNLHFFAARRAAYIVTISQALKHIFVSAGFDEKKILVAPSGVDLSIFDINISKEDARKELDLPQEARIALYTGNFTTMGADKGIADIIKALKDAPDVMFVAVGGGEGDMALYGEQAKNAGIEQRVILRGYAPQTKLAIYQKAADVLLMPFPDTPHYRNHMSPVKMFEYMASDRPIIASDLPTIREVLNESNAILVPPNNPAQIARALTALASSSKGQEIAQKAREQAHQFSWNERAKKILDTLRAKI